MSVIKPHFCVWLFYARTQLNEKKTMICKGWEKKRPTSKLQSKFLDGSIGNEYIIFFFSSNLTHELEVDKITKQ
jgi:hypothetical protein